MFPGKHVYTLIYPDGYSWSGNFTQVLNYLRSEFEVLPPKNTIKKRFFTWGRMLPVERVVALSKQPWLWFDGVEGFSDAVTAHQVWLAWVSAAGKTNPVPRTIRRRLIAGGRTKDAILTSRRHPVKKLGRLAGRKSRPKIALSPKHAERHGLGNITLEPVTHCAQSLPHIESWKGWDTKYYRRNYEIASDQDAANDLITLP